MRPFLASFPASPLAIVTLLFAVAASVQSVHAATLVVTTTADSGAESLRDTIAAAADGDTIQFDAALNGQTITLTSAELLVDKNLTIDGPGAHQLTVQRSTATGTPAFRIFNAFGTDGLNSVTIAGLTITNGNAPTAGGGIVQSGIALTVANCVITGNSAPNGGGIYCGGAMVSPSRVNIANCTISGNSATSGGGIFITGPMGMLFRGSTLTMTGSTISANLATSSGGGINNQGGLTVTNSTISANSATGDETGGGGGIFSTGNSRITNSTISGNAARLGGGIRNFSTHAFLTRAY